jgi:ABC-2 family transporter protein
MTALTVRPPGRQAGHRPPVPWRKLAWVTWRQHRTTLAGAATLLGGVSLWMLINGLLVRSAMNSLDLSACHHLRASGCATRLQTFADEGYPATANTFTGVLQAVPALIGVFVGGPLLARELETGTFRFAWTQGCGRLRWIVAKMVPLAALVTAAAAGVSLVTDWYLQPFFAVGMADPFRPTLFDLRGVDFAAWTLAAFALAAFAGVVIRRTVPAMAAASGAWAGLLLVTTLYLRAHYQAPLVGKQNAMRGGGLPWVLNHWMTGPGGHVISQPGPVIGRALSAVAREGKLEPGAVFGPTSAVERWLAQHGYANWISYQPASRFWHFQLIEGGWLLALALLLIAATFWLVRSRSA